MNKYITLTIISLTLTACAINFDSVPDYENNRCVSSNAAYEFHYLEVSGNCGHIPVMTKFVPSSGIVSIDDNCASNSGSYAQGCSSHINASCYVNNGVIGTFGGVNYTYLTESGSINYSGDGLYAYGKVSITLSSYGGAYCHSVYNVIANRL